MIDDGTSGAAGISRMSVAESLFRLMRPAQWTKNVVVFAGVVFAEATDQPRSLMEAAVALIAFILASSAIYVFNDRMDADADRDHPLKRHRPIATGDISESIADRFAVLLGLASLVTAQTVGYEFVAIVGTYLVSMVAYTLWFKHVPILDVTAIALGFVLRAAGGAAAVAVPISGWLLTCAFLLSLFLGFSKRRSEYQALGDGASRVRVSLQGYTQPLLDQLVGISAMSALVTYAIYTIDSSSVPVSDAMVMTLPFVAFAIFRYLFLVYGRGLGQSPEVLLFRDKWLLGSVILWGGLAIVLMEFA